MKILKDKPTLIITLITLIGAFLHFFNLNWGAPYYFHPDERNVASAISQLRFPDQFNPHFFAYGSLPIYTVFFTGILSKLITNASQANQISFDQAILIGRVYSALFATALIPLIFSITKMLLKHVTSPDRRENAGIFAASMAVMSAGFIQFAHFGTFEMWLTFFTVLLFGACLKMLKKPNTFNTLLLGLVFGVLLATKISSLALLPLPLITIAIAHKKRAKFSLHMLANFLYSFFFFFCMVGIIYILSNPFVFLDTEAFLSSMRYESAVGLHTLPVFYTQAFYDTIPVIYQFLNIYPFLLNPLLTILFVPSFLYILFIGLKTKNVPYLLIIVFYVILFISQAVLFIKWTRYMLPTLPFIFMIIAVALVEIASLISKHTNASKVVNATMTFIVSICSLFSLSYFISAYVQTDTRIAALHYANARIPENSVILSETYDLGITAFNETFPTIILFNSYDTDDNSPDYNLQTWKAALESADYVILPSQRVLQTRLQNAGRYPAGNKMYTSLLNGKSDFEKIYETPCDVFCQVAYFGDPTFHYEQTATVFDRPTVYIFQKVK